MRWVAVALALVVAACTGAGDVAEGVGVSRDQARRTTLSVAVDGLPPLRLDLTEEPPTIEPNHDPDVGIGAADVDAARELIAWVLRLPSPQGCTVSSVPRLQVEWYQLPDPGEAEFADLATGTFGSPCEDLSDEQYAEFVRLWNATGGALPEPTAATP